MFLDFTTVLIFSVGILATFLYSFPRRPKDFPPGPPVMPVIGNVLSLTSDPRATFRRLRRRYGDVFSVYVFNKPIIVLNGYKVLKEALVTNADVFSDRPSSFLTDHLLRGRGIVGTSGSVWLEQRKFAASTLRAFAHGKSSLEKKVHQELEFFLPSLGQHCGAAFDCKELVAGAVSNVICSMVFGKRFEYTDPLFTAILKNMDENVQSIKSASILNVLPAVRYLPGDLFRFQRILDILTFTEQEFVLPEIREHLQRREEVKADDFITAYINEMNRRQQHSIDSPMSIDDLQSVILDLFGTGSETVTTILRWTLALFLNHPDVQTRCFNEISENTEQGRLPSIEDRTKLPYFQAVITEVLRFANIVPAGVPHSVPHDIKFRGYSIPKGVMVLPVLDSALHDPEVWDDPEQFRPERFLDGEGRFVRKDEFVPYSLGPRVCLGKSVANTELFLFLSAMVQTFHFCCEDGTKPSLLPVCGIVHSPRPFLVKVTRRPRP